MKREYYYDRIAKARCPDCGELSFNGMTYCLECRKERAKRESIRRQMLKDNISKTMLIKDSGDGEKKGSVLTADCQQESTQ